MKPVQYLIESLSAFEKANIDKNVRIGDGVVVMPHGIPDNLDGENYYIRVKSGLFILATTIRLPLVKVIWISSHNAKIVAPLWLDIHCFSSMSQCRRCRYSSSGSKNETSNCRNRRL
jgi:hypothetical protein